MPQPGTNSLIGIADNTGNEGFCLKNRCKNFDTARRGHAPALQPSIGKLNDKLEFIEMGDSCSAARKTVPFRGVTGKNN